MKLSRRALSGVSWIALGLSLFNFWYSTSFLVKNNVHVEQIELLFLGGFNGSRVQNLSTIDPTKQQQHSRSNLYVLQKQQQNQTTPSLHVKQQNQTNAPTSGFRLQQNETKEKPTHLLQTEALEQLQAQNDKKSIHPMNSSVKYVSDEYRINRMNEYDSWFKNGTGNLLPNADKNGPVLDFAIIGFPKCGTTTIEANLGLKAPLPIADVCTPVHQTVYYAYHNWPKMYSYGNKEAKILRGTKCPAFINGEWLKQWSTHLPRTKLILGIRHPILWFQSFWNMQAGNKLTGFAKDDPYMITKPCPLELGKPNCLNDCPGRQLFCTQRASFHVAMARLGKTQLTKEERMLLSYKQYPNRAGMNLENHNITNSIFVYELKELNQDYVWDDMAEYLQYPRRIPHNLYKSSHGRNQAKGLNFCDEKFDALRAMMMPESYDLSVWLQKYFIPLARDPNRTDVVIPKPDRFQEIVESYKYDPCKRLFRQDDGSFALGQNFTVDVTQ